MLFQQLLYLSDLPENQVHVIMQEAAYPTLEISQLLLLRTAKKVIFREQWKKRV